MLKYNLQLFGGRGSAASRSNIEPEKSLEDLKAERLAAGQEYLDFINSHADSEGVMESEADIAKAIELQEKFAAAKYEVEKRISPAVKKDENWKGSGITDLTKEDAMTVRQDMLKNKNMYMAIKNAEYGVFYGSETADTAIDRLYNSNPTSTYKIFEPTRQLLTKKYGKTMTLYRVPTAQTSKATFNMTSTKANAQQYAQLYGGKVESFKVSVENILAINISRNGAYEEFIVLNRKKR